LPAAPEGLPEPLTGLDAAAPFGAPGRLQRLLELGLLLVYECLCLLPGDAAELEQVVEVVHAHRLPLADLLVHPWVGEGRLVALVVAAPPVAVHVDHHVATETFPEVHRDVDHLRDRLGVLAVDVEDGDLEHLGDVRGVRVRTTLVRRRGESDLVVDDHVQRAADGVAGQLAQVQRLLHDAFARERGVAMDQDDHAGAALTVALVVLLGAHPAERHRVDVLEVARVEAHREMDRMPGRRHPVAAVAEVVLDVPAATELLGSVVLELAEDRLRILPQDVRQHIEAAAVRHPEDDLADAVRARLLHRQVEQRDEALGALEREALGADVLLLDEALEHGRIRQPPQDAKLRVAVEPDVVLRGLHARLEPGARLQVVDVHELDTDEPAVGAAHPVVQLADGHHVGAGEVACRHRRMQALRPDLERRQLQLGRERPLAERVELRGDVAADAERTHHLVDPVLEQARLFARHLGGAGRCGSKESRRLEGGADSERARGAIAAAVAAEVAEVLPPVARHRLRVGEVVGEQALDVAEAQAVQAGFAHDALRGGPASRG
jgi:hypothetical protein